MSKNKTLEKKPLKLNNDLRKYINKKVNEYRLDLSNQLNNTDSNEELSLKEMVNSIQLDEWLFDYHISNLIESIFNENCNKIFDHLLVKKYVEIKSTDKYSCFNKTLLNIDTKEKYLDYLKSIYKDYTEDIINEFKDNIKNKLITIVRRNNLNIPHLISNTDSITLTIINKLSQGEVTFYSLEELDTYIKNEVSKYVSK